MNLVVEILICVGLILTGAALPKPVGWVVLVLGLIALLFVILGGFPIAHR